MSALIKVYSLNIHFIICQLYVNKAVNKLSDIQRGRHTYLIFNTKIEITKRKSDSYDLISRQTSENIIYIYIHTYIRTHIYIQECNFKHDEERK